MRYLPEVIDKMLSLIPHEEERLINEMTSIKNSALTASPEMMPHWWQAIADALYNQFGTPPEKGWGYKIMKIWMSEDLDLEE